VIRRCLAALVFCALAATASAASKAPDPQTPAAAGQDNISGPVETPAQVFADAMRQSIGGPARADLGPEATVRLAEGQLIVPRDPAARLLKINDKTFPPDLLALLMTSQGLEAPGYIRFVASGYVNADSALAWTADDYLDSLRDTIEAENAEREKKGLAPREARRWIRPPHYNAEAHTLTWAALIIPKSAPRESDGEIVFYGLAFGREGYLQVAVPSSVEQADDVGSMVDAFLRGVAFRPGKTYIEYQSGDPRSPAGLAGTMGIDKLHKARDQSRFFSSDVLIPAVGALVATIGAISLFFYVQRHMRRLARRV
jgi:uncharacterized membrane-anchored protein